MLVEFVQWDPCDVTKFEILKVKTPLRFWTKQYWVWVTATMKFQLWELGNKFRVMRYEIWELRYSQPKQVLGRVQPCESLLLNSSEKRKKEKKKKTSFSQNFELKPKYLRAYLLLSPTQLK